MTNKEIEYLNKFHKEQTQLGLQSIAKWKKNPPTIEQVLEQQAKLNRQRAIRVSRVNLPITALEIRELNKKQGAWVKLRKKEFSPEEFQERMRLIINLFRQDMQLVLETDEYPR